MQRDGICSSIYRLSWKVSYGLYTGCPGGQFKSLYAECPGSQFKSLYTGCPGDQFTTLHTGCPGGQFISLYTGCPGGRFTLYTGCFKCRFIKRGEVWNCDYFNVRSVDICSSGSTVVTQDHASTGFGRFGVWVFCGWCVGVLWLADTTTGRLWNASTIPVKRISEHRVHTVALISLFHKQRVSAG